MQDILVRALEKEVADVKKALYVDLQTATKEWDEYSEQSEWQRKQFPKSPADLAKKAVERILTAVNKYNAVETQLGNARAGRFTLGVSA
jgi:hypothetical protein